MTKQTLRVLSAPIDTVTWDAALQRIHHWAARRESRYVCICNAHSVVTAGQDAAFGRVVLEADMATPDGAPVAWMLRKLGATQQQRINGPDLMWRYCEQAAQRGESIYLYGGTHTTLALLQKRLAQEFPRLAGGRGLFAPVSGAECRRRRSGGGGHQCLWRWNGLGEPGVPQARAVDGVAPRSGERGDGGRWRRL